MDPASVWLVWQHDPHYAGGHDSLVAGWGNEADALLYCEQRNAAETDSYHYHISRLDLSKPNGRDEPRGGQGSD